MEQTHSRLNGLSSDDLLDLAVRTRRVLDLLEEDVASSERERQARGKCDPIRDLTGQNAMERAMRETQSLLARIEAVLTDRVAAKEVSRSPEAHKPPVIEARTAPYCGVRR